VTYVAVIIVDNSNEDPELGRTGLRDELLPVLKTLPGFIDARLMTDYERGRGAAVVTFHERVQAEALAGNVVVGQPIREGVIALSSEVMEVTAEG